MPDRSVPLSCRTFLLASALALVAAACATAPPLPPIEQEAPEETLRSLLAPHTTPIVRPAPTDPGILALAEALQGRERTVLVLSGPAGTTLAAGLTESLIEMDGVRAIEVEGLEDAVTVLNGYSSGAPTSAMATEVVAPAPLPDYISRTATADLLTWLRGWNAVRIDAPVVFAPAAPELQQSDAPVVTWLSAAGEGQQVTVLQLADALPLDGSGWIDLKALPEHALIDAWRAETPGLANPDGSWAADYALFHKTQP